jgi:hypothetical protein
MQFQGVSNAHHMAQRTLDSGHSSDSDIASQFRDYTGSMLDYVHESSWLQYDHSSQSSTQEPPPMC